MPVYLVKLIMRTVYKIAFFLITTVILPFSNCTTKYSDPYSAGNVVRTLSKQYATEIEIVDVKKNKTSDGKKYNEYVLRDKQRGFLFEAGSYIRMDRHIILYSRERWDQYSRDLMRHYHRDVMHIAGKYNLLLIPPLRDLPEVRMKAHSPVQPLDSVYIRSPEQLDRAVDLYIELAYFYNFSYVRYHKNESRNPKFVLSYLPENETDRSKSVKFCRLLYLEYRMEPSGADPHSYKGKITYINYIPDKDEVRKKIYQCWNDAIDKGKIVREKVEYKNPFGQTDSGFPKHGVRFTNPAPDFQNMASDSPI